MRSQGASKWIRCPLTCLLLARGPVDWGISPNDDHAFAGVQTHREEGDRPRARRLTKHQGILTLAVRGYTKRSSLLQMQSLWPAVQWIPYHGQEAPATHDGIKHCPRRLLPCAGAALEQPGTQVEQEPPEQQALQQEAASQAQGLPDEAMMKQQV